MWLVLMHKLAEEDLPRGKEIVKITGGLNVWWLAERQGAGKQAGGDWAGWENGDAEEKAPKHSEDDWGKW